MDVHVGRLRKVPSRGRERDPIRTVRVVVRKCPLQGYSATPSPRARNWPSSHYWSLSWAACPASNRWPRRLAPGGGAAPGFA